MGLNFFLKNWSTCLGQLEIQISRCSWPTCVGFLTYNVVTCVADLLRVGHKKAVLRRVAGLQAQCFYKSEN